MEISKTNETCVLNTIRVSLTRIYIILFVFLSFADWSFTLGGMQIKIIYLLELFIIPVALLQLFTKKGIIRKFEIYNFFWLISYFFCLNNIISLSDFKIVVIGQCALFVLYLYIKNYESHFDFEKAFFNICVIIAIIGIIQFLVFVLFKINIGVSHYDSYVGLPRPRSILAEPDWYGLVCGIGTVYYAIKKVSLERNNKRLDLKLFVLIVGLLISFTRAAWLGTAVALLLFFVFFSSKENRIYIVKYGFKILMIFCIIMVFVFIAKPEIMDKLLNRILPSRWHDDGGAFDTRSYSISIMKYYIEKNPFFGNGVGSMNYISTNKELLAKFGYYWEINTGRGNANIFITNMFDCGIVGTLFLVLSLLYYSKCMIKAYKKSKNIKFIMYFCCFIVFMVDFQFNNGYRFAFIWLFMAFTLRESERELVKQQRHSLNDYAVLFE